MQSLKKFYFGKQKVKVPNTFIGGIGGTINTPALLAAKLGIAENRIKLFKVTGVDVECAVIGSYTLNEKLRTYGCTYYESTTATSQSSGQEWTYENQLKKVILPNMTYARGATFYQNSGIRIYYCPIATNIGEYDSSNIYVGVGGKTRTFEAIQSGFKLYCNPSLATANNGNPVADITTILSRGGIVRYVTNFTPPNTVANLSTGTIYNTAIQLNFTPPTSVNGVDFYEVYINGERFSTREIKSSGEYITGLTPSTNYNIRIVAVDMFYNKSELSNTVNVSTSNYDTNASSPTAESEAYITAATIVDITQQEAVRKMCFQLMNQGYLWGKIQAFYPFLGTTSAQHKWNAKNPLDTNAAFRLQFFGGGTHSNLGYQCNGTNAYANTFLVPSAVQNVNSNGMTVTVGTNNSTTQNDVVEIGSFVSVTQASLITVKSNNTTFRRFSRMNGVAILQDNQNDAKGIFTSVKQFSTVTKLLRNKVEIASGNSGGTLPTVSVFIGNMSLNGTPYANGWSNQRIQFTAIHEGLTDAEVVALHTIIDNFESAIGRKTW